MLPFEVAGRPGWISWVFLVGVVFICVGAWISRRAVMRGEDLPPARVLFPSIAVQLSVVGAVALAAAWDAGVDLWAPGPPDRGDVGLGIAVLAIMLASAWPLWRATSPEERVRRAQLLPGNRAEAAWIVVVSVLAGVCEEIAWRGVLPALIAHWTGGTLVPVLLAAIVFGVAHMVQGRLATVVVFGIALLFHLLVGLTGALWMAMIVHAIYDALVGVWIGPWLHRRSART